MQSEIRNIAGPAIHAIHPWVPRNQEKSVRHQLLSDHERAQLAKIATIVRFNKGELIYQEGDAADAAFNIVSGVVAAFRIVNEAEHVLSFLYTGDLFGLSEEGRYSNSTEAATAVVAYKMPLPAVRRILDNNAGLDVEVIIKLCEELREAQRQSAPGIAAVADKWLIT
jgi:CRP-like cAMP-binding protein